MTQLSYAKLAPPAPDVPADLPRRRAALFAGIGTATIHVQDLRLRTYIGFNPDERAKQQDVVINLHIDHRVDPAVMDDRIDCALNYRTITKAVIELVENGRFLLLERLVGEVLAVCADDPRVLRARARIDKPHALRFADSVSLTMEYDADGAALAGPTRSNPEPDQ